MSLERFSHYRFLPDEMDSLFGRAFPLPYSSQGYHYLPVVESHRSICLTVRGSYWNRRCRYVSYSAYLIRDSDQSGGRDRVEILPLVSFPSAGNAHFQKRAMLKDYAKSRYCVWIAFGIIFIYVMFPETSGRTLEELTFRKRYYLEH